jgi:hypothetical protein
MRARIAASSLMSLALALALALSVPGGALAQDWTVHGRLGYGTSDAVSCLPSKGGGQILTSLCVSVGCRIGEAPSFGFSLQQAALPSETRMGVAVDGRPVADLTFVVEGGGTGGEAPLQGRETLLEALRTGQVARFGIEAVEGRRDYELPLSGAREAIDTALAACSSPSSEPVAAGKPGQEPAGRFSDDPAGEAIAENEAFCAGGAAAVGPGFVRQADVDGDGVNDVLIDYMGLTCDGSWGFCGTGGCSQEVWLGDRAGPYRLLLADQILLIELPEPGRLRVTMDGGDCGLSGAEICEYEYRVEDGALRPLD